MRVAYALVLVLLLSPAAHGVRSAPAGLFEPVRRFLADGISGMGPNTFLAQTKRADAVATADLQEVAARAGDFEQPSKRRAGRDRRLFSDGISGMGLNTFLAQTKRAAAVTTADLQEVSAHAGDFQKPVKSRPEWGRRLLSDGISGMGPNTFLAQTKRAAAVTTADLQEVSAHAGDFQKPVKSRPEWGRRLRRLLLWQTCFDDC